MPGTITFNGEADTHRFPRTSAWAMGLSLVPEGRRPVSAPHGAAQPGAWGLHPQRQAMKSRVVSTRCSRFFPDPQGAAQSQLAGTMSGGEQQMLAIGRGLMARAQAPDAGRALMGDRAEVRRPRCSIVIQQVNAQASRSCWSNRTCRRRWAIAHYGYVIQTGRIVMQGKGQDLLHDERYQEGLSGPLTQRDSTHFMTSIFSQPKSAAPGRARRPLQGSDVGPCARLFCRPT